MKVSKKQASAIYGTIHHVLTDLRIELRRDGLPDALDVKVAQVELALWRELKPILGLSEDGKAGSV